MKRPTEPQLPLASSWTRTHAETVSATRWTRDTDTTGEPALSAHTTGRHPAPKSHTHFIHGHSHVRPGPGPGRAVCQAVVGLRGLPGLTKVSKASTLSAARPPADTACQRAVGVRVLRLRNRALRSWACWGHFRLRSGCCSVCSSWHRAPFTLAPARSRRLFFRVPLPPGPPRCSWGATGSAPEPRRCRRLILLLDPELGSGHESSFLPFPKTARPRERGTVKAWLPHFRSDCRRSSRTPRRTRKRTRQPPQHAHPRQQECPCQCGCQVPRPSGRDVRQCWLPTWQADPGKPAGKPAGRQT